MKPLYLFAFTAALAVSAPVLAADAPPMIAVVNIQQIMKDSTAAKMVHDKVEDKQKSFQTELTKRDEELQKEDKDLAGQRGALSKDAFEEKSRAFRKKVTDVQKDVQTKKITLDNAYGHALAEIQKAVSEIVADLAKEKGFLLAIPMEAPPSWQILYADNKLDISSEVLERLNKKLPKVDVKFEAPTEKK
jgi:outer membrane protein